MKDTTSTTQDSRHSPLQHKLTLTALGLSGAAVTTAPQSDAAIVSLSTLPVATLSLEWDVDGDGTVDFAIGDFGNTTIGAAAASFVGRNGGRLVQPAPASPSGIARLSAGVVVGATLAPAYAFRASVTNFNPVALTPAPYAVSSVAPNALAGGWSNATSQGFFGFQFTNASGTHFGWGEMNIVSGPSHGFQITQVHYDDTPNASVTVGSVPEPSSIALLALGAAGLVSVRRRRTAA